MRRGGERGEVLLRKGGGRHGVRGLGYRFDERGGRVVCSAALWRCTTRATEHVCPEGKKYEGRMIPKLFNKLRPINGTGAFHVDAYGRADAAI